MGAGVEYVWLKTAEGRKVGKRAHALVARTFLGPKPAGHKISFLDGNTKNHRLSNLSYTAKRTICTDQIFDFCPGDSLPPDEPEKWFRVPGQPQGLSVSTLGRVRKGDVVLSINYSSAYPMVPIRVPDHKRKTATCHSLVARAFFGERPVGYDIAHLDDDKTNNRLSNLEYQTKSQNCKQAGAKLKKTVLATNGDNVLRFSCSEEAAEYFKTTTDTMRGRCLHERTVSTEFGTFLFQYEDGPGVARTPAPEGLEWREIERFPNYECCREGLVRRKGSNWTLRQSCTGMYPSCTFVLNGRHCTATVHKLVALAYIGDPPWPSAKLRHKNGNRMDASADNLEWFIPESHTLGKACERRLPDGTCERYISMADAKRKLGINVAGALAGKQKTAGNSTWRFLE